MNSHKNIFKKFSLIDSEYLLSEMHCHTTYTDGLSSIEDIAEKAEQLGLKTLFFTDHVRRSSTYFPEYASIIRSYAESELKTLVGFEAKIADLEGNLDIAEGCRNEADIIIATVHSFPSENDFVHPRELDEKTIQETEYKLVLNAVEKGNFDIVGHVGGMSIAMNGSFPIEYIEEIISKCSETDKVFEINSRYHIEIIDQLTDLLKKYDPFVSIGSDAHSIDEIGTCSKLMRDILI